MFIKHFLKTLYKATLAGSFVPDEDLMPESCGNLFITISLCSPKDTFKKKEGIQKCMDRLPSKTVLIINVKSQKEAKLKFYSLCSLVQGNLDNKRSARNIMRLVEFAKGEKDC